MAKIAEVGEVDAALARLSERADGPFVVRLPRAPGTRDARYAHLLGGDVPIAAQAEAHPVVAESGPALASRVARLETEMAELRRQIEELMRGTPHGGQ